MPTTVVALLVACLSLVGFALSARVRTFAYERAALLMCGGFVLAGMVLIEQGATLTANQGAQWLGTFLTSLGSTSIAVALTFLLFQLNDTASYVRRVVTEVFSSDGGIDALSEASKAKLLRSLNLDSVRDTNKELPKALYEEWIRLGKSYLSSPILENYDYDLEISSHPENAALTVQEATLRYTVSVGHLKDERARFVVRWNMAWTVPASAALTPAQAVPQFEVLVDGVVLVTGRVPELNIRDARLEFSLNIAEEIDIQFSSEIQIKISFVTSSADWTDSLAMSYPTRALNTRVSIDEERLFDHHLFAASLAGDPALGALEVDGRDRRIRARHGGWVFPGGGICVNFPRPSAFQAMLSRAQARSDAAQVASDHEK